MVAMFGAVPLACGRRFHVVDQLLRGGSMVVSFSDLQLAFEFVSSGRGENEAYPGEADHFDEHRQRRIADQSLFVAGAPRWQRDHAIEQRASS